MLGACVVPRAPHLVHTSGIWVTGRKREVSDSTLCRQAQTQSTQESKASKQQASHLLAELRRHDCYTLCRGCHGRGCTPHRQTHSQKASHNAAHSSSGQALVKHWSNTGQTLVKHWSNTGQALVKHRTGKQQAGCPPPVNVLLLRGALSMTAQGTRSSLWLLWRRRALAVKRRLRLVMGLVPAARHAAVACALLPCVPSLLLSLLCAAALYSRLQAACARLDCVSWPHVSPFRCWYQEILPVFGQGSYAP